MGSLSSEVMDKEGELLGLHGYHGNISATLLPSCDGSPEK